MYVQTIIQICIRGTEWQSGLRRQFEPRPRVALLFGQSWCLKREAAIPRPGMVDAYGCLLENSAKNTRV